MVLYLSLFYSFLASFRRRPETIIMLQSDLIFEKRFYEGVLCVFKPMIKQLGSK